MLPWALYNLTPRDQGSPLIRPFYYQNSGTDAGPSSFLASSFTIPPETICLMTMIAMRLRGGGGGNASYLEWNVSSTTGIGFPLFQASHVRQNMNSEAALSKTWAGSPLFMMTDQQTLSFNANYALPHIGAVYLFSACGFLIPRGTLAIT